MLKGKGEYILAITGASGAILGVRLLERLRSLGFEVHLILSREARAILREETGREPKALSSLASFSYAEEDLSAPLASGSFVAPNIRAMVVVPCSMKTLAAIAGGYADNLITRAADVVLKEGKELLLVVRESPFNAIHLENMLKLALLGVRIIPAMPCFYQRPKTVEELVDQMVSRILDQLGIHEKEGSRWKGRRPRVEGRKRVKRPRS